MSEKLQPKQKTRNIKAKLFVITVREKFYKYFQSRGELEQHS